MENYRLLERLGKGGQGSVYAVENKDDAKKYVLKKIECHDESEANKAFKEALALQQLQHPYVCGYKEFFVTWDKEESSMFVCIVMQHYANGDLKKIIQKFQATKSPIEEETVKKYLGEILEALIFVHMRGTIHRDLKPSNIFIQDDGSICLGDFGVATIMADARTCTRNTVGTTNYMAPEVQDNPYDERSDVWALGCILFELTTTSLFDYAQVAEKMKEFKHDPGVLEIIFEEVAKNFSGSLITVIRTMLKYNPSQRTTASELADKSPYIKECLTMSDSTMLEKRKRLSENPDGVDPLACVSPDILVMLEHMAKNIDKEVCVREAMEHLAIITRKDGVVLETSGKRLVSAAMKNHDHNKTIQIAGINVMNNVIVSACLGDILFTPEIIVAVVSAMKCHSSCMELQQTGAALLMALSADNQAAECIGKLGGINQILGAMKSNIKNSELCAICCSALWSLTITENNAELASDNKALETVCTAMKTHPTVPAVMEAGSAALFSLCMDENCFELVNDLDVVGMLLNAVEIHEKNPKVVKNIFMALSGLIEPDEECAYRILTSEESNTEHSNDGIPVLMKAYELHKDNADVVEALVTLIMELTEYDDICKDLVSLKVQALLKEIQLKFNKNESVFVPLDEVRSELSFLNVTTKVLWPVQIRFRDNMNIMKPCETATKKLEQVVN